MKFAGKRFQQKECAASVTVWIRQCAVSLFESFNGVAQPFEFVEGHLKFRICHLVILTPQEARPDLYRGRSVAWTLAHSQVHRTPRQRWSCCLAVAHDYIPTPRFGFRLLN